MVFNMDMLYYFFWFSIIIAGNLFILITGIMSVATLIEALKRR